MGTSAQITHNIYHYAGKESQHGDKGAADAGHVATCRKQYVPAIRPHRLLETTLTLGTKEAAFIFIAVRRSLNTANAEGMRWGGDMKYGGGMGSPDLYQYLVEHSYRPNEHLDALHKVTLTACVLNWPRR